MFLVRAGLMFSGYCGPPRRQAMSLVTTDLLGGTHAVVCGRILDSLICPGWGSNSTCLFKDEAFLLVFESDVKPLERLICIGTGR